MSIKIERNLQYFFANLIILGLFGSGLVLSACNDKEQQPSVFAATVNTSSAVPYTSRTVASSPTLSSSVLVTNPTLSSSTSTPIGLASPTVGNKDWYQWLRGIPCRPPCYGNIIPDRTRPEEAKKLLQQNPLVDKIETFPSFNGSPEAIIVWYWKKELVGANFPTNKEGGAIFFDDKVAGTPIKHIELIAISLSLEQVIQAYGEPSSVIATFWNNYHGGGSYYYSVDFLYLSQGFSVSTGSVTSKPILNKDLQLSKVQFSVPGEDGIKPIVGIYGKELLVPWQGFKDWKFYCRYYYDYGKRTEVRDCSQVPGIGSP